MFRNERCKKHCYLFSITLLFLYGACGVSITENAEESVTGTVRMEVTGSGSVTTAQIITKDTNGELVHGTEQENGSIEPEEGELPWSYEYDIIASQSHYYYLKAENDTRDTILSGTVNTWDENRLVDPSASFSSSVEAGLIVYNATDDIAREIEAVNSDTDLTLSGYLNATDTREYILYKSSYVTGTTDPAAPSDNHLTDSAAAFLSLNVEAGDVTRNDNTGNLAVISVVTQTELTLNTDIFNGGEEDYTIFLKSGEATSARDSSLVDGGASFLSSNMTEYGFVKNLDTDEAADIEEITSETELKLDKDIFPGGNEKYVLYTTASVPQYSTCYKANCLVDTATDFDDVAVVGEVIHNTYDDRYGVIAGIDAANHEITFSNEVFPPRNIDYGVYKNRSITCNIYLDDERIDTTGSTHWNEVEASLSGTFSASATE